MKIKMTIYFMIFILISQTSCLESIGDLQNEEAEKIKNYLSSNPAMDFKKKESGLYYLEKTEGTGLQVTDSSTVYVFYTEELLSGAEIESNWGTSDTLIFPVGSGYMIPGFEEGISFMKEGGESVFLVPSSLAYGSTGNYYDIPGYTPLLFEVKLLKVK